MKEDPPLLTHKICAERRNHHQRQWQDHEQKTLEPLNPNPMQHIKCYAIKETVRVQTVSRAQKTTMSTWRLFISHVSLLIVHPSGWYLQQYQIGFLWSKYVFRLSDASVFPLAKLCIWNCSVTEKGRDEVIYCAKVFKKTFEGWLSCCSWLVAPAFQK